MIGKQQVGRDEYDIKNPDLVWLRAELTKPGDEIRNVGFLLRLFTKLLQQPTNCPLGELFVL